ncbi:rhomboid family intramembrane serine protease [Mangrovibacterium diazotrophicum]|uniref:Membrane associated rhomboid family serine protease n=1 Tax=Mangrovibacterium diazotrophicum TaxID=1261403 RepID=A0A419W4T2_9BACT|nr:rhomboid family intramembrane serine protease [Mangrovibacterium diazotrophicum]RKD90464.1 membrane associated rhomboid family serine protease [Mangrovibacterium diazotrophicum]
MPIFTIILIATISGLTIYGFNNSDFYEKYSFNVGAIKNEKEYYRIITSAFIHVDYTHLVFNMVSLYTFAEFVEIEYTSKVIFLSFLLSVIGGGVYSLINNWKNDNYSAVGASGGVCGIIYSSIFLMETGSVYIMFIPIPIPDYVYAALFIWGSYYLMKKGTDNIGHDAHIGGAITGIIYAISVIPWVFLQEFRIILIMFLPFAVLYIHERYFM